MQFCRDSPIAVAAAMLQSNLLNRRSHFHLLLRWLPFLQRTVETSATDRNQLAHAHRYSGRLAKILLLGSARRCRPASFVAFLASSLYFLQGTSEKIHLQGLFCQQLLQAMDLFAVGRCVRAGPQRFFSGLNDFQLPAPLVEASSGHP